MPHWLDGRPVRFVDGGGQGLYFLIRFPCGKGHFYQLLFRSAPLIVAECRIFKMFHALRGVQQIRKAGPMKIRVKTIQEILNKCKDIL